MSKSFYSVSDLGEKLNVPRTTINDYLARYGHYIEFEIHGKRKVYTDKSLEILREIANMRAGNTAFYDIEQYLMQKYPVQPDLHQDSNKNNSEIKTESECSNMENNDENKNFQMVNIEEIKSLVQFVNRAEENQRNAITRSTRRILWPVVLLLLIVLVTGVISVLLGAKLMLTVQDANKSAAEQNAANAAAITEKFTAAEQALLKEVRNGVENFNAEQKNQLDALIFKLEEQANEQQKEIVTLRGEMLEQRKSAKNQFDELQKAMTGRLESETKLLQEEHTRQLEAIREKEKQLSGELNAEKSKAENLQKQLDELTLVNNSLSTENDKLGKLNSNQADELAAVRAELAEAMKKLEALSNNQDAATQTTENDMNNAEPTPQEEVETPAVIEPVGGNITVIQSASENK